ncbi:hypothetical protein D5F01_LYC25055 [Xyrichtys novacula]|uniref:Uncharacterized protein n=1 Tax=Xyrichtys novacula TaxID=13765 RepID=A0AAV1HEK1_XYRNO|nr:hypothetical protein D5F01_LYC25055 [Xyrichtys novacula]
MTYEQEQWTEVRYGRRRGRRPYRTDQQYQTGSWGTGNRGMDRAPPVSYSRRQSPFSRKPNRPVPPPRFSAPSRPRRPGPPPHYRPRFWGPQSGSYASVLHQGNPTRNQGGFPYRRPYYHQNTTQQSRPMPAPSAQQAPVHDPQFGQLVRKLHTIIKMVHHLQNVTPGPEKQDPKMIARMVDNLATMIKPANPTTYTLDMIMGNAKNWGHTTLLLLQDHYTAELEKMQGDLSKEPPQEWKSAFTVATRWARKNLFRIKQEVIDHAEALIASCVKPDAAQDRQAAPSEPAAAQEKQNNDQHHSPSASTRNRRRSQEDPSQVQFLEEVVVPTEEPAPQSVEKHVHTKQTPQQKTQSAQAQQQQNKTPPQQQRQKTPPQQNKTPQTFPKSRTPEFTPSQKAFWEDIIQELTPSTEMTSTPITKPGLGKTAQVLSDILGENTEGELHLSPTNPFRASPKEQRTKRPFQGQTPVHTPHTEPQHNKQNEKQTPTNTTKQYSHIGEDQATELDTTPVLSPQKICVTAQVHRDPVETQNSPLELDRELLEFLEGSPPSPPKPTTYKPKRHINTDKKMTDWSLTVTKKWLFIGDSNLARMPMHSIPDLQIDSYPGANFRHAQGILSNATSEVTVEKVLLSFGLNARAQKVKETSIKQLQAAVRLAKNKFPYAEIWIPKINYSSFLPTQEKLNLQLLNAYIFRNMPYIESLERDKFLTEVDHIHWTRTTAKSMFDHWVSHLNLKAP